MRKDLLESGKSNNNSNLEGIENSFPLCWCPYFYCSKEFGFLLFQFFKLKRTGLEHYIGFLHTKKCISKHFLFVF